MRGIWNRKAPQTYAKRVVDCAKTLDGVVAGEKFDTGCKSTSDSRGASDHTLYLPLIDGLLLDRIFSSS